MWALALVRCSRMTHSKKVKNKVSHSRVKVTRVDMAEMMKKRKNQSRQSQTPIAQISTNHQRERKLLSLSPGRKLRR